MEEALSSQVKSIIPASSKSTGNDDNVVLWTPTGASSTLVVSLTDTEKPDVVAFVAQAEDGKPAPANLDDLFPATLDALRATVQTKKTPQSQEEPYTTKPGDTSPEVSSKRFNTQLVE